MAEINDTKGPFGRPGFAIAAALVILLVVVGVVVITLNITRGAPGSAGPGPSPFDSPSRTVEPTPSALSESICGLPSATGDERVSTAPAAEWAYQGTTAYPTSPTFGPGASMPNGVRYCFQHSPRGALFAAANAMAQGSDPAAAKEWVNYALADGPYRDQLRTRIGSGSTGSGTRLAIVGFRMLQFSEDRARVDLAVRATSSARAIAVSGVYELVWQKGDWKISSDVSNPMDLATIPDTAGYIPWTE